MRNFMKINDDLWVLFDEEDTNMDLSTFFHIMLDVLKNIFIIGLLFFLVLGLLTLLCEALS